MERSSRSPRLSGTRVMLWLYSRAHAHPRAVASHTVAGRVEATRLAVRAREETVARAAADAPLREGERALGCGRERPAGVELQVEIDAGADVRVVRHL